MVFYPLKLVLMFLIITHFSVGHTQEEKTWIFFDIGNTLIDSRVDGDFFMLEGAMSYIESLSKNGYSLGIISNVPPDWNVETLKRFIEDNWRKDSPRFPWKVFEDRILIPDLARHRKPNPYLFKKAKKISKGNVAFFFSENKKEVEVARVEGFLTYQVWQADRDPYLSLEKIAQFSSKNPIDTLNICP